MKYFTGELIDTAEGFLTVQTVFEFKHNDNPSYNKLGGKALYWLQKEDQTDVLLWDFELKRILSEGEKLVINQEQEGFYV